ncbi:RhuM family protein [Pusillimonas sp. SM2304]|uniref:RhuM family protein n=1 Tax=Pusillimonas sp. SM2304 TaxID=3073241 RepID=UPI00287465BA|nr:RhuM family protein [Pusillimonas sp. SM2304]MDS1140878.1 RhuM family protein [Pusillimonas sp. SM2304]
MISLKIMGLLCISGASKKDAWCGLIPWDKVTPSPENVLMHLKYIYDAEELTEPATTKDFLVVRTEGKRQVKRSLRHYSLDAIISVGYRVNSTLLVLKASLLYHQGPFAYHRYAVRLFPYFHEMGISADINFIRLAALVL